MIKTKDNVAGFELLETRLVVEVPLGNGGFRTTVPVFCRFIFSRLKRSSVWRVGSRDQSSVSQFAELFIGSEEANVVAIEDDSCSVPGDALTDARGPSGSRAAILVEIRLREPPRRARKWLF